MNGSSRDRHRHVRLEGGGIEDGRLKRFVEDRYAGWGGEFGRKALAELNLAELADHALATQSDALPPSGRLEYLGET